KPSCEMVCTGNVLKLNTEVYGGPILYTWFDRPLSLSGRVMLRGASPLEPVSRLLKIDRPLLTIPHLAIHYNRSVNEGNPLSKQRDMLPVMAILADRSAADGLMVNRVARELGVDASEILDYDLTLYDVTPACRFGLDNEFISSGRIDDLMMAHAAVSALTGSLADDREFRATRVMAIFDNEETGSGTRQGAASPVLRSILSRISASYPCAGEDTYLRAVARSFMISADNGHAIHPNYEAKQDPTNHPVLGGGPVVKINANCKYMTDASSAAVFRSICEEAGVRVQTFVNHSDTPGGSTLGNILTSQIDLDGVDMGAPQWAMHSCRETAAVADHLSVIKAFTRFYTL
ncbi:MAG: M18 family aminopeptidase, partial [Muribaculaceae bacterium]|nr:M18 family aminopeptidase [Muribaculaceae bacterium]